MTSKNMRAIQTVTVGAGGIAEIDFQSIPQTYTDLMLVFSTREESTASAEMFLKFNNTTSNLQTKWFRGNGSSATSGTTSNMQLLTNSNSALASTFSNTYFYIPNYAGNNNKSAMSDGVVENNVTNSPDVFQNMAAYLWSDTAAITRITAYLSSGDFAEHSTATLYGVFKYVGDSSPKALGGTVTSDSTYWYHTFTNTGVFTPNQSVTADVLVIAGGGAAGFSYGGGGGGGGIFYATSQSLTAQNYAVTVGAGGSNRGSFGQGSNGSNSVFGSLTAAVGGGGGGAGVNPANIAGASGGSGGGGGPIAGGGATTQTGTGGTGYGFAGAAGYWDGGGGASGGGGGAGGSPAAPTSRVGGNAGNGTGTFSSWGSATATGVLSSGTYYYSGGGVGGGNNGFGSAGTQGGAGSYVNGAVSTGQGGGCEGTTGGSGIVIVRYAK